MAVVMRSKKKKGIALLLLFFLGYLGAHRFYLGRPKTGVLYLLALGILGIGPNVLPDIFTYEVLSVIAVIFAIAWILDLFLLLFGVLKDGNGLTLRPLFSRERSRRRKTTALLLCLFLGMLGIHRFYLGRTKSALIWLFTLGLFGFGWFYDFFGILLGTLKDIDNLPLAS